MHFDDLTTWHLANLADCGSPDRGDGIGTTPPTDNADPSPGAEFLRRVANGVAEQIAWAVDNDEADPDTLRDELPHQVADDAVPIYTRDIWSTFMDLAAYREDPSELGYDCADMERAAGVCLYMIADRLAAALVEEWADEREGVDA